MENRGVLVLVHGDYTFGVFHSSQMLHCTADADGDVQLWSHDRARLSHLGRVNSISVAWLAVEMKLKKRLSIWGERERERIKS